MHEEKRLFRCMLNLTPLSANSVCFRPAVEYIEPIILSEEEEQMLENEAENEDEAAEPGSGNFEVLT